MLTKQLMMMRPSLVHYRSMAASAQATDPIQKLFIDKIREYKQKSAGGKLVDASPEIQRELKQESDKLDKMFGASSGVDMTQFPTIKFEEPKLDPISFESKQ